MYNSRTIAENIYYVGVNDRQKELFENYLPLPHGVAYNSYLIADEKVALIDTVDVNFAHTLFSKIDAILNGRQIDYLIVNHMEPDHAGSIDLLRSKYPNVQIVANAKTMDMLKGYFNITSNIREVKEGDCLELGKRTLTFFMMPMVHWPEVMVAYENADKILFSADAFGTFGTNDGDYLDENLNTDKYWDEMRRYYACIVGKYGVPVQNALKKLSALPISLICATHGPVWKKEIAKVVGLYDRWSRYEAETGLVIAYASMYGHTQLMAEAVAEGAIAGGVKNVVIHNVSKTDSSFILADIFKYNGLVIGSPTYMGEVYPLIEKLVTAIEHRGIKNRLYSCFGSYTWAGAAAKKLTALAENMNWELVGNPVENKQNVSAEKYAACFALGLEMARKLML